MKQRPTIIEADPSFAYSFIHTAFSTMRFLFWATGHMLFGAALYSFLTGNDRLLTGIVDGTLYLPLAYGMIFCLLLSGLAGVLAAVAQPLVGRLKVARTQRQ